MSKLPKLRPSLTDYVVNQTRQAARQARTSAFALSGTAVTAEGVVTVDGELDINGPLAVHGTATFDGDTTIGGNAAITGTLSLPAGIIDNAALTSPVVPQKVYFTATHTLTAATQTVATSTFTVPAGFTTALVSVSARAYATNQNTSGGADGLGGDYFGIAPTVGAVVGGATNFVKGSNGYGECVALASDLLTGLTPGGTFTIPVTAATNYFTWTTGIGVVVSGTILWLR